MGNSIYIYIYIYVKHNEPQSAYAQHILNNKYKYCPINNNTNLLKHIRKLDYYYDTNKYTSKNITNTSSLVQNNAKANLIPYISWSMTHSTRHFPRDQPINTQSETEIKQSILTLLTRCQQTWYINVELYYIGRIHHIFWKILILHFM